LFRLFRIDFGLITGEKYRFTLYSDGQRTFRRGKKNVSMYRQAAAVIDNVNRHNIMTVFLDKTQHLAAKRP